MTPPIDFTDPLQALEDIIGKQIPEKESDGTSSQVIEKPSELDEEIDFNGLGLHEFLQEEDDDREGRKDEVKQHAEECEYVCSNGDNEGSTLKVGQMKKTRTDSGISIDRFLYVVSFIVGQNAS